VLEGAVPAQTGPVTLFEERWFADAEKALSRADHVSKHEVDKDSVELVKAEAPTPTPTSVA
jgi:hypothetical protein